MSTSRKAAKAETAHELCERDRKAGILPSWFDVALEAEEMNGGTSGRIRVFDENDNLVEETRQ